MPPPLRDCDNRGVPGRGRGAGYNPPMPDILLATLNARYSHASLGLRYLRANLGERRRVGFEPTALSMTRR
jgi:hypothetical protein